MSESTTISSPENSSGAPFLDLYRYSQNISSTRTGTLLLLLLLAGALWPLVAHESLLAWSMLVCAVQAGQAWLAHRYLNDRQDYSKKPHVWKWRFLALAVVSGAVWGAPFMAFGLTAHDPAFFALLFAIAGVTAYGGMAKLPVLSIALTFEAVVLLPLSAWLFLQGGAIPEFMGIAVLLYLAMLSLLFRQTSIVAAQRHSLQAHKEELSSLRQDSDQRMGRFLEYVPGLFVTLRRDRDGVMTMPFARGSSPAFQELDPRALAESIEPLLALCHPEDSAPLLAELHASAQEQRPCHVEFRIGDPSSTQRVMELTAQPLQGAEPGVMEWHGFMQDITEHRRLAEQLKMKSHVLDHSSEALYLVGEQGQFVYVNNQACRQLGYRREELLQMSVPDIDQGFDQSKLREQRETVLESGVFVFETEHIRRDGSSFPVEIQASHLAYNGQLLGLCLAHDITERKAVEKSLRDSEAMLQEAQRIAHVGSWDVDMVNDKLTWSDETFRIWEIDKTKFKADVAAFLETVHPEDRERVNRVYSESVANHTLYEVEHRLLFPDGRIKHILERGEPQYDAEGKPVRFIGTCFDITERRQMEEQLRMKEYALDNSKDAVFLIDEEARFIYVNEQACKSLGYGRDELLTMSTPDIDPDYSLEKAKGANAAAVASGDIFFETRHQRRDGSIFPVEIQLSALEYGGRTLTMAMVRNIAERKLAEAALTKREREFRSLAENIPDNIARWDTEGRYLYVNPTHERLLGMKLEDLVGRSIPDSYAHVKAGIMQVVASGQAIHAVRQSAMVDGIEELHDVSLVPELDKTGKVVSVLGLGRNMTAIYRMQDAIAAREREFRSLAENMPDSVVRWDREGRYTYINPTLERALGASLGEIVGKLPSEAFPDRRFEPLEIAIGKLLAGSGNVACVPQPVPTPNGQMAFHEVNLVVERDTAGEVIGVLGLGRDLTEHKRMQETIAAREQEFRSLAESAPDNITRYDREGRCLYLNGRLARYLGLTSMDEVIGKRPNEIWPDGRFSVLEETAAQAVASGERAELELTVPDGKGGWLHHWISVMPELDAAGNIIGTIAFGRDISERKQMEEALRRSEQLMRTVIDATPDWIFIKDREHRYHMANQGYASALHLTPEDFIGKDDLDLGFPEELVKGNPEKGIRGFWADDRLVMESNQTQTYLADPATIDGVVHTFHTIKVPLRDADGKAWGVLAFARDISKLKAMEQALAEREAFLSTLLDAIAIPVFYKDRQGRYLGINRAFEQYFGATRENLIGKSVFDTHPREFAEVYHAKDVEVFERRVERQEYEFRIKHSDGTDRDVMFSKAAFTDASGEVKGLIGAVMDITERKQAEIKLQERFDQIVELNDLLSENARQLEEQATELEASQEQLKETEAWYRGILHSAPDGMMVVDDGGRIVLVNEELERMFGYAHGELLGQPLEVLLPVELRTAHVGLRRDYFGNSSKPDLPGQGRNLRACRQDGSEFVVDVSLSRLPPNNYNDGAICAAVRDVTERRRGEQEMAETRNRLKSVLHTIPDLVWMKNTEGEYLACNPAFEKFFGASETQIIGKTDHDFVESELADFFRQKDLEAIEAGRVLVNEEWVTYADDGRQGLLETRKVPVFNAESKVTGVLGVARDITERKRLEMELAKREHEFRTLVENAADTVARYGKDMCRLYANPSFAELVEGGVDALLGKKPSEAPGGPHADVYEEKLAEVMATGEEIEFELRWTDKSGRELCSLINLTPEFSKDGTVETVLAVGRDISELYAVRQKIHQMAFYDTLTELPNRALFNDRLRQMIADASWHHQLGGVMMLDMDRFKEINDTMGHAVGDELLREAGARLSACVRSYDTVARLGGDEFAILLPDVRHSDDIGRIADKMRSTFDSPFLLSGKEVFVTCSIGIALYPDDSTEADDLLRYADSAMYFAKRSGRNAFRFYSRDLTESANERLMLESELRRAVERGELEMYYQPKVRLSDGALVGSEALLRWKHPQRGMIPPDKFIPIAEDSGLIIEIGEWVLRESCRAAVAMNGAGKPMHKVAINLSARQFQNGDLLAVVSRVLDETRCRPEWIELEITESLLLDEDGRVLEVLKAFRSLGITVAIDDFGTGYSALSYLARFPITTLKIDRSFVGRIDSDSFRAELVKAILSIAHCLGQEVVAEGVETAGQAAFLTTHGCQVAQGYLFSKPVPMAEFMALPGAFQVG